MAALAGLAAVAVAVRAADDPSVREERRAASTVPAADGRGEATVTRACDIGSLTTDVPNFADAPSLGMSGRLPVGSGGGSGQGPFGGRRPRRGQR